MGILKQVSEGEGADLHYVILRIFDIMTNTFELATSNWS
jgi:hypothetical protein